MIKNNITKKAARNRVALFLLDIASCFGNVIELALSLGSIKIERGGHGKKKTAQDSGSLWCKRNILSLHYSWHTCGSRRTTVGFLYVLSTFMFQ